MADRDGTPREPVTGPRAHRDGVPREPVTGRRADRDRDRAEFDGFVRRRQHRLLRVAYLLAGDESLAADLLRDALVRLADRWPTVRDGQPEVAVRQILYRGAASRRRRRRWERLVSDAVTNPRRLRDLLRDKAKRVQPPALAESSWRLAAVRRRRRRAATGAVAAVLAALVAVGGVATVRDHDTHRPPAVVGSASPAPRDRLPTATTRLPRTIETDPSVARPLSAAPVRHALGLFAAYPPSWPQDPPDLATVLVLGDDGQMRRIDTTRIRGTGDGLAPAPVLPGGLNASGTVAAFPQPGGTVLTVDLTRDRHHRYRIGGGTVQSMWWVGGDELVLGTDTSTRILELRAGTVRTLRLGTALAPRRPTARSGFVTFGPAPDAEPGTEIRRYDRDGRRLGTAHSTWWYAHFYGPGFTDGRRAVRSAFETGFYPHGGGNTVVVVPVRGGGTPTPIPCPTGTGPAQKASCVLLGWPATDRLMVLDHEHSAHQLLAVDPGTGRVAAVARLTRDAQVALRPGVA